MTNEQLEKANKLKERINEVNNIIEQVNERLLSATEIAIRNVVPGTNNVYISGELKDKIVKFILDELEKSSRMYKDEFEKL